MVRRCRHRRARRAAVVFAAPVGAEAQEQLDDVRVASLRGDAERRGPSVVYRVLVRAGIKESGDRGCVPGLKGSIGEGPNHSNFSNQSSVKTLSKFNAFF